MAPTTRRDKTRRLRLLLVIVAVTQLGLVGLLAAAHLHARGAVLEAASAPLSRVRDGARARVVAHFEGARTALEGLARSGGALDAAALSRAARSHHLARLELVAAGRPGRAAVASCVRDARQRRRVVFADHAQVRPGQVAAYLCHALPDGRALVAEVDQTRLDRLAAFREAAPAGGQIYLVGGDLRLRSSFIDQGKARSVEGKLRVRTTSARRAMRGISGALLEDNAAGQPVLAAFAPLRVFDSHWAIIAETPRSAAMGPAGPLIWYVRAGILLAALLVALLIWSGLTARRRPEPAAQDPAATAPEPTSRWLAPMVVGVAFLAAASTLLLPERLMEPDDEAFRAAMRLFSSGSLTRPLDGTLPQGWAQVPGRWLMSEKPPGHPLALAALHRLGLERLVNPLWVAACALALMLLGGALHPRPRHRLYMVALLVANPTLLLMTHRTYMSDLPGAAAITCFAALFLAAELDGGGRRRYMLAGLLLGLAVVIRYTNLVACLVVPLYYAVSGLLRQRAARGLISWVRTAGPWLVAAGAAVPLSGQLLYNWATTGSPLKVGYSFTLFLTGEPRFGERFLMHNLLDVPPLLLLGFPCLVLLPLGLARLYHRSQRAALFCALLAGAFILFYMASYWVRADHFVFTSRYYLPALFGLTFCAAEALESFSSRRAAVATVALLVLLSAALAGDFARRYVLADTWYIRSGTIESKHTLDDLQDPY